MRTGRTARRAALLALGAVVALLLAGCAGDGGPLRRPARRTLGAADVNPMDPVALRDGGDLRLPLDSLPTNYNNLQVDGAGVQTGQILGAVIPRAFHEGVDGDPALDPNYVTSVELTSTKPQTITYEINPKATWNSGRPITWADFEAQWRALNGTNPAYRASSTTGYDGITSVTAGTSEKQVVVTFGSTFAEWQGLFSPLYPGETNSDPARFNTGWVNAVLDSAGPFTLGSLDPTAQTLTLVRNPSWWGERPRLDRLIFRVLDRAALADEMADDGIDWYAIGSSVDLFQRARTTPGVVVRQALEKQYSHITFNGAPGAVLADPALRRAVVKGIDAPAICRRMVGRIVPEVVTQGSHLLPIGAPGYTDNSAVTAFDQAAARAELDALGWVQRGDTRVRDGRELRLRFVSTAGNPISDQVARTVQEQLSQIGVRVAVVAVPPARFFSDAVEPGDFDLTFFQWTTGSAPFSSVAAIYAEPGGPIGHNYGSVFDQRIVDLFDQGTGELDPAVRRQLADRIDKLIWEEVHHLPLYPATGAYAVRDTLANWGAPGLGDWDYVHAGFIR